MHVISTEARITSNHVISTETAGSPASALYSLGCKRSEVESPLYFPLPEAVTKLPPLREIFGGLNQTFPEASRSDAPDAGDSKAARARNSQVKR